MKQINLFGSEFTSNDENKYTKKVESPIYEPKNKKPHIFELYDKSKTQRLIREIEKSSLGFEEKNFLIDSARRHNVFNYEKIADYYANSSKEMQNLMEKSALVIIDFEKAIQLGYVKLCDEIRTQYLEVYEQ
jgi:geranylgeranyl pyrophosphate synthase